MEFHKDWLESNWNGAFLFGDAHYWSSIDVTQNVKLRAVMPRTVKPCNGVVKVGDQEIIVDSMDFTREQNAIRRIRPNVERPFGQVKTIFASLGNKFNEKSRPLDCLVKFALAVLLKKSKYYK